MKTYIMIDDQDGNNTFEIKAENDNDAYAKALKFLGWNISKKEGDKKC